MLQYHPRRLATAQRVLTPTYPETRYLGIAVCGILRFGGWTMDTPPVPRSDCFSQHAELRMSILSPSQLSSSSMFSMVSHHHISLAHRENPSLEMLGKHIRSLPSFARTSRRSSRNGERHCVLLTSARTARGIYSTSSTTVDVEQCKYERRRRYPPSTQQRSISFFDFRAGIYGRAHCRTVQLR